MSRQIFFIKDLFLLIRYFKNKNGFLFGYMQCNLIVPDKLKPALSNFLPISEKIGVCRNDIGDYLKNYAKENDLLKNQQRMLISIFKLENGIIITTHLNFYLSV